MKKFFTALTALTVSLASLPVFSAYAAETTYALGDVDMDGIVTGHDTAMVSRYVLDDTYALTDAQLQLADVNEDGTVDQTDADILYQDLQVYSLGDVNLDGEAVPTVSSASSVCLYYAKTNVGLPSDLTQVQLNLADCNLDGTLDITDASDLLTLNARYAAGLSPFPTEGAYFF
jgi:hypothetical protein